MERHNYPVTTLSNGLRVANFSSAHEYHFVDGSVLPACSAERCTWLSMDPVETPIPNARGWIDIDIFFSPSAQVLAQLQVLENDPNVDVVLAPRIVREAFGKGSFSKLRTNRLADRVKKLNHIDRFCV